MKKSYERMAIIFPVLGLAAIIYNVAAALIRNHLTIAILINILWLFLLTMPSILCLIPRLEKLKVIHPIVLGLGASVAIIQTPLHFFGYLIFILFVVMLRVYGYMKLGFLIKSVLLAAYLLVIASVSTIIQKLNLVTVLGQVFFVTGFAVILYQLLYTRISEEKKPILDFKSVGVTGVHEDICRLVHANDRIDSKALSQLLSAQIGDDFSPSYIDNHLSSIYKKIGVGDRSELKAYLSKFRIE